LRYGGIKDKRRRGQRSLYYQSTDEKKENDIERQRPKAKGKVGEL